MQALKPHRFFLDVRVLTGLPDRRHGTRELAVVRGVRLSETVHGDVCLDLGELVGVRAHDRLEVGLEGGLRGRPRARRGLGLVLAAAGDQTERQQQGQEQGTTSHAA